MCNGELTISDYSGDTKSFDRPRRMKRVKEKEKQGWNVEALKNVIYLAHTSSISIIA